MLDAGESSLVEMRAEFRDKSEYDKWDAESAELRQGPTIDALVRHVRRNGLIDPLHGRVGAQDIEIVAPNYRESLKALGTNSRGRAVLYLLSLLRHQGEREIDVYASEETTLFADRLRRIFPSFIGSEYIPGSEKEKHPSIHHEDIQDLSFESGSFDLYVSCEVLEHVPFVDRALREARRVLRPGGIFMGTVPFRVDRDNTLVRARMDGDAIEHVMEPEYHDNPVDPKGGSLVFEIPGWDFLPRLRSAGFRDSKMIFLMSTNMGIVAPWSGGVLCFEALA